MRHFPQKTKLSKVGSNLKDLKALTEAKKLEIDSRNSAYRKAQTEFMRQRDTILTTKAVKKAVPIFRNNKSTFDHAFLGSNGEVEKIAKLKKKTRSSIESELLKSIPKYERYRAIEKSYIENHRVLRNEEIRSDRRNQLEIHLGDKVVTGNLDQEFTPTYELFVVLDNKFNNSVVYDESFAEPFSGILVNNIRFHQGDDSWGPYSRLEIATTSSSLGIRYEVPQTGRLKCSAIIQNLYNKLSLSVTDNFGFSHTCLDFYQYLDFTISRTREARTQGVIRKMITTGLVSHGGELARATSNIQNSTPYTLSFTSQVPYEKGETLQILAGSNIFIRCDIDDMEAYVDAVFMWQLKKIIVGVSV